MAFTPNWQTKWWLESADKSGSCTNEKGAHSKSQK